ncbi:MAG: patatin-like phospholipase family protein [Chitinophagaceae bacterium]
MKQSLRSIFYSFPVQLVLLHFKKFQVLIIFWFILFSAVNGSFMKMYGVDSLYLAPEYLGNVNFLSTAIVGIALGIFIMSWNITTFILFSRHFKFLATTTNPFLKYCINNAGIPLVFLLFYFINGLSFGVYKELLSLWEIFLLISGFLAGLFFSISGSFYYFFRADKTINRHMFMGGEHTENFNQKDQSHILQTSGGSRLMKVQSYFHRPLTIKPVRDVSHYSSAFIEKIFSRHHFAAVLSIFASFVFLIIVGFFLDRHIFQLPAAASITIFFAILVAVAGAFSYFLQSWSVPFLVLLFILFNFLYKYEVIDPTNKAYGLDYSNRKDRPIYDQQSLLNLCTPEHVKNDMDHMIEVLQNWKKKQLEKKPVLFVIATSGGGTRSATFTLNILQYLDSLSGGKLMDKTFMITGASGGMLGASYFRELAREKANGQPIKLQDKQYLHDISRDLLNPMLSSLIARDLTSPAQKFKIGEFYYIKDRGYAFEQKLAENTRWLLNKQLKDIADDEFTAKIPLMLFNSVITRDSRRMIISTQPVSFLMKPSYDTSRISEMDPDAVDFGALFSKQQPMNLRLLSALRMNATFPYILPNVWLPSKPVIDVMDAGLRDNFGQESALRFLFVFRKWLQANTSKVVLIQIRDRKSGGWENPFESDNISEIITKPMLLLQNNYYKMQEYNQNEIISLESFLNLKFNKLSFQYAPRKEDMTAALNFHLTRREKQNIEDATGNENNVKTFEKFKALIK